jgi:hypothetical protein
MSRATARLFPVPEKQKIIFPIKYSFFTCTLQGIVLGRYPLPFRHRSDAMVGPDKR